MEIVIDGPTEADVALRCAPAWRPASRQGAAGGLLRHLGRQLRRQSLGLPLPPAQAEGGRAHERIHAEAEEERRRCGSTCAAMPPGAADGAMPRSRCPSATATFARAAGGSSSPSRHRDDDTLVLEGDLALRPHRLADGRGTLIAEMEYDHAGGAMRGGGARGHGEPGAAEMRAGGRREIEGDVGDFAVSTLPGKA